MSSADIRRMFAGLPGAHGIIEAALNGQGRVITDDSARPSSAAVLAGDFLFFGGEPSEELVRRAQSRVDCAGEQCVSRAGAGAAVGNVVGAHRL